MLKFAYDYEVELNIKMREALLDDKNKYYFFASYRDFTLDITRSSWREIQMVSIKDNNVIGYIGAYIDRDARNVTDIYAINFYDVNYTFSKDFRIFLTDLFDKYQFNKVNFKVIAGNPAEQMYDKYIEKYNGRIVGIRKQEVRLIDGNLYDDKLYEVMRSDYEKSKVKNT